MKYVIIIPDGCADEPQESLDGKTPLEAAYTPAMDEVARSGIVGRANHTPRHLTAGSDVANMSLFGYDPVANFSGRAPLEAAAQGIELTANDWAIRCNLVTIENQIMRDFTADHITSEQAKSLLATAQERLNDPRFEFVPGVSYRNLLLFRGKPDASPFSFDTRCTPPHDLTDKSVENDFPRGPGSDILSKLMSDSVDWFANHEVNQARIAAGHLPATNLWLWGLGQRPNLAPFKEVFGKSGAMITAVDLLRGLARILGWDRIEVPGATGYTDTDYAAKGRYGIGAVDKYDLVCIHVEATDEASHEGDVAAKIKALEKIDADIVAPVLKKLKTLAAWRLLVTPDHPTYIRTKTHTHGDVPFAMCGTGIAADTAACYGESVAATSKHAFDQGFRLMPFFLSE
jgi:2,3-bisphosphoglycerate-independent phosphoglycerate mutase